MLVWCEKCVIYVGHREDYAKRESKNFCFSCPGGQKGRSGSIIIRLKTQLIDSVLWRSTCYLSPSHLLSHYIVILPMRPFIYHRARKKCGFNVRHSRFASRNGSKRGGTNRRAERFIRQCSSRGIPRQAVSVMSSITQVRVL